MPDHIVDVVGRRLASGFVLTSHDLPSDLLATSYGMPAGLFAQPATTKPPHTGSRVRLG